MSDEKQSSALQKVSKDQALTYAKWGLMGLGVIWIIGFVLKVLFNPLFLVATVAAGAGGFYWWAKKGKDDPDVQAATERVAQEVDRARHAADALGQVAALSKSLGASNAPAAPRPPSTHPSASAAPPSAPPASPAAAAYGAPALEEAPAPALASPATSPPRPAASISPQAEKQLSDFDRRLAELERMKAELDS